MLLTQKSVACQGLLRLYSVTTCLYWPPSLVLTYNHIGSCSYQTASATIPYACLRVMT